MTQARPKLSLFLVLLVAFIDWMGLGLVYPMFSSIIFQENSPLIPSGASDSAKGLYLGFLLASFPIAQFFSSPVLGSLSDAKGRKKILCYSLAIAVFGYILGCIGIFISSIGLLIIYRLIVGISGGSAAVVAAAIADLSTNESKAKHYGLYSMACGVGFAVGPFLGGVLSESSWGYAAPFFFSGVVSFINLVLVYFFFRETNYSTKVGKLGFAMGISNIKKAFQLKAMRVLFLVIFVTCFGWSFFYEFIPITWIQEYNLSPAGVGTLYAYAAAFYALSSGLLIRPALKRFSTNFLLFIAITLSGLYTLVMLFPISYLGLYFYQPLQQYLMAIFWPTSTTLVSNYADKNVQGEILGIMQSVIAVAFAISPLLAGPLLGLSIKMPVIVGGVCFLIAGAILGLVLRKESLSKIKS